MGLLLFQLPPNFKASTERLADLLALSALKNCPPHAFEFRNDTWLSPETHAILAQHNAALCIAESEEREAPEVHTAGTHTCFRLRIPGGSTSRQLTAVAERLSALSQDRGVYAYFKHEDEPTGELNAMAFLKSAAQRTRRAGK